MDAENARRVLKDIFAKHKIPADDLTFDFFAKMDATGTYKEPLIIGVTEKNVAVVRRKRWCFGSRLFYHLIPLSAVEVFLSCVHRKSVIFRTSTDYPLRAVIADCGRSVPELAKCWSKWSEFLTLQSVPLQRRQKKRIRRGSYGIRTGTEDPFQDYSFEKQKEYLIEEDFFHFWLQTERRVQPGNPIRGSTTSTVDSKPRALKKDHREETGNYNRREETRPSIRDGYSQEIEDRIWQNMVLDKKESKEKSTGCCGSWC